MDVFVVRVWVPGIEERNDGEVHGVVEHLATGRSSSFRDAAELVRILRDPVGEEPIRSL